MMSKLQEIYDGWKNLLVPNEEMKPYIEEVAAERIKICRECKFNSKNDKSIHLRFDEHCTDCGCTLSAKTRSLTSKCPLIPPKWDAAVK